MSDADPDVDGVRVKKAVSDSEDSQTSVFYPAADRNLVTWVKLFRQGLPASGKGQGFRQMGEKLFPPLTFEDTPLSLGIQRLYDKGRSQGP